jgi:hypothetical protein
MRQLTPEQARRLAAMRRLARMLDSSMAIPGTPYRFGLDPVLGLVPGLGDLVSPLFAIGLLWLARDLGVPRVVRLRMVYHVAIDALVGLVPVLGDLFDVAWKANDRNVALLERHARGEHPPASGDWLFVVATTLLLAGIAIVPLLLLVWVVRALSGAGG